MKTLHVLPVLLLVGALLLSCNRDSETGLAPAPAAAQPYAVVMVPTQTVTAFTTYPARITGVVTSEVRAKIPGYITEVLVDEGARVRRGQPLFRLETQALDQDAAAARANVSAAQVEVDKLRPLVEKDIISPVQLRTAEARLQQAQSGLDAIAANINYGRIVSPIDGYLGRIVSRKGALVTPASPEPLTTVSDVSRVYAYFSLNEAEYLDFMQRTVGRTVEEKIDNLPPVSLILSNGSVYEEPGEIEAIISQVNAQTGSVQFRAVFDNPARLLNDGNSATVRVPETLAEATVVPQTATFDQQGTTYVYLLAPDSTAVAVPITVQAQVDGLFVVASGLKPGDRIVATGLAKLRGGVKVKPMPMAFDSIARPLPTVFR